MTEIWLALSIKSTVVLAMAAVTALLQQRRSAAVRHLVWLAALSSVLVLTISPLFPDASTAFDLQPVAAVTLAVNGLARTGSGALPWIGVLWLAGSLLLIARLATGFLRTARLVRTAKHVHFEGAFEVRLAPGWDTPAAWSFSRQIVLLPESAAAWPVDRRRAVLLHEMAHLERRDCWALLIAEIACALYWFSPLVWYAASRMRREQEHAADDRVLCQGIDAAEYATHLLAIARADRHSYLLAGAATASNLSARVEAILNSGRRRRMQTRRMMLASFAAAFAVVLPLTSMQTGRKTHKVDEAGVTRPELLYKVEPGYTEEAKNAHIEGSVVLAAVVEADGQVYDIAVDRVLDPGLDANAVAAVEKWRFKPAEKDGKPVAVSVKIEVNFRLL